MKINESNFVEELSHRNEKALEYVMVHYGGLVKSVTHRYLNVLSQYEEECINDVFFAVWEHIDSYDSARNPFCLLYTSHSSIKIRIKNIFCPLLYLLMCISYCTTAVTGFK